MEKLGKMVKVVAGASGSRRITIPKKISDHTDLQAGEFVYVSVNEENKIMVEPMQFIRKK